MPDRNEEKETQLSQAEKWLEDVIDPTVDQDEQDEQDEQEDQDG